MADSSLGGTMAGVSAESGAATGSAKKTAGASDNGGYGELYKLNQVWYHMPPTLSLVAKRTILINLAQNASYTQNVTNSNITFIFNTGEFFISPTTSYLYLRIGYNTPASYNRAKALIGQGNVMQLFEEIVFTSASGTEVCREQNKGLNAAVTYRYNNTQEYIDTIGDLQGAPRGPYHKNHDGVAPITATLNGSVTTDPDAIFQHMGGYDGLIWPRSGPAVKSQWGVSCTNINRYSGKIQNDGTAPLPAEPPLQTLAFCVPLDQILGMFDPYMKALIPAGLIAGGRLDLRLKDPAESLQFISSASALAASGANANLTALVNAKNSIQISEIYIAFDAFQFQDNVLVKLNEVSSGPDGLSLLFNTYDYTSVNKSGTGSVECQVQQARSRIIRSWCVIRDSANIKNPYINSLCSEAVVRRACGRIGPGAPVSASSATTNTTVSYGSSFTPLNVVTSQIANGGYTLANLIAAGFVVPLQLVPPLPADPYINDSTGLTPIVSSYQGILGALYFPLQPLTNAYEYYQNALYIFGKCIPDKNATCSVTFEDFLGGTGAGLYLNGVAIDPSLATSIRTWCAPYGLAVFGLLAEKNQALQLSGLPISNARLLRHRIEFAYQCLSGLDRTIHCCTDYTRLAKIYLGGRIVVRE